jgi:hypothetical protein
VYLEDVLVSFVLEVIAKPIGAALRDNGISSDDFIS